MSGRLDELLDSIEEEELYEDAFGARDIDQRDIDMALAALDQAVEEMVRVVSNPDYYGHYYATRAHGYGRLVLVWAMKNKSAPRGKAKEFENLQEALKSRKKRFARKAAFNWVKKNEKRIRWMLESVMRWPDKDESTGLIEVAGFRLLDQISASAKATKSVSEAINRCAAMMNKSGVHGVARAMYGDVILTGKAMPTRTLAYYRPREDDVWVKMKGTMGSSFEHAFIHEVGHRYYRKFMESRAKMEWSDHHNGCRRSAASASSGGGIDIAVGDPFPIPVQGMKRGGPPIVTKISPLYYTVEIRTKSGKVKTGDIRRSAVDSVMQRRSGASMFPSAYSATNSEEHWCEAFSFYCTKDLKGTHKEAFERIMGL